MKRNARKVILDILNQVDKGAYVSSLMQEIYTMEGLSTLDRNFIGKVVYGVLEQRIYIDYIIRHYSTVRLKKIEVEILNILRMSVYQYLFMDKTPDSAVANESVKLAKKVQPRYSGFVNGVLRNMMRDDQEVQLPDVSKTPFLHYSVKYAHPEWMVKRFVEIFGLDFAIELMIANNKTPHISLRTNTLLINRDNLMTKLKEMGINSKKSDIVEDGILVEEGKQLMLLDNPLFLEGFFSIQDESSMMVTELLKPCPGDLVLDLCAAPGGKCTHIAEKLAGQGKVTACDISDKKLIGIEENKKRLSLNTIETCINDGTVYNSKFEKAFDKVLLDAPCSGLGIIRRKPDIKYNRSEGDSQALMAVQKKMLQLGCQYVKPGGVLVYSTCTVDPIENEGVIEDFLSENQDFEKDQSLEENEIKLYPNINGTDGFYCCRLKKK